jgi:soluble lytic murein transglycosylase-like protein
MPPLSFIQSRIAEIEHYINNVELRVNRVLANDGPKPAALANEEIDSGFSQILASKIDATQLRAEKQASLSKLPENFNEYLSNTVTEMSQEYNVELPESLVLSVIKQESGFNPGARSSAGAEGLMQLMPATAKNMGVFNTMNPYQNLRGGIKYLAMQIQAFDGNIPKALAAYNAGPEAVKRYNGIPPYKETQNYVESIMADYLRQENYNSVDVIA